MNASRTVNDPGRLRERLVWTAAVAVLLTTVAWLGTIVLALSLRTMEAGWARAAVIGRVLLEAMLAFGPELLAMGVATVAFSILVGLLLPRTIASWPARKGAYHG